MAVAVPLVQDDRFWPDNPGCTLHEEWRRELEIYLDERAILSEHSVNSVDIVSEEGRGARRRIMWFRVSGVRPADPIERKTTKWYKRSKKEAPRHPRYTRIKLIVAPDIDGTLVTDVRREYPKPAPNRRKDAVPPIELDALGDDPIEAATTEVAAVEDADVVMEESPVDQAAMARVLVPEPVVKVVAEIADYDDSDLLEVIGNDPDGLMQELPEGCCVDDDSPLNRRRELEMLANAARTDPAWA